jgi:hypothetical protein
MFSYHAYGLGIHSEFPIPEFVLAQVQADVVIRLAPSEPSGLLEQAAVVELDTQEATLAFGCAGVFRIRRGCEILVTPAPGADLSLVRLYLVGKVMATLLYQRGFLVLHASAVEVRGHAVVFVGSSGFGKSSLAASLHVCGHKVVADDVVPVDLTSQVPLAIPGFPQLKVHPEIASSLEYDKQSLVPLHPLEPKYGLPVPDMFAGAPVPLGLIYLLGFGAPGPSDSLKPQDVLIELVRHSFPARLLRSGGAPHLRQCASLAKLVPILRFNRTDAWIPPAKLASRVWQDLSGRGDRFLDVESRRAPEVSVRC